MAQVGRLHLYLPPFRNRVSEDAPTAEEDIQLEWSGGSDEGGSSSGDNGSVERSREVKVNGYYYRHKAAQERERQRKLKRKIWFKEEANTFLSSSLPFWRRNSQEYIALVVSFLFLIAESLVRIITLALPGPVLRFFYMKSRALFNTFSPSSYTTTSSTQKEKDIVAEMRDADGFVEMCAIWGYEAEEHIVQTGDGYLLGLHRVRKKGVGEKRGRERSRGGAQRKDRNEASGRKVVYLHHGLLMNSEVWVCLLEKEHCLPFTLVDQGYDVWLGNNRGNKYSKKSTHYPSTTPEFWDFSMDEFAMHDIPDSINYILETTKSHSLSYIGFSQGTAQAFATLSIHPALNEKVDVFIALAPAMSPAGLHNSIVDAFIKASPNVLYLLFGRKSILSSTTFWQSVLYPPIFVRVIDAALTFLFNWRGVNITLNQKIAAYSHLYSFTSVKSVVHWFQIMRNKSFQMYDDDIQPFLSFSGRNFYKVAKFPTRNITTPIVLVYGGSDSLVDIDVMLRELPGHTVATGIPHYEHLDMLWAQDVDKLVHPTVLEALERYSLSCEGELEKPTLVQIGHTDGDIKQVPTASVISALRSETTGEVPPSYSDDEKGLGIAAEGNAENSSAGRKRASSNPLQHLNTVKEGPQNTRTPTTTSPRPIPTTRHTDVHNIARLSSSAPANSTAAVPTSSSPFSSSTFSIFNPSLFTRRLSRRSESLSSALSSTASIASSTRSNASDKVFAPNGILLPRAMASTGISTSQTVDGLSDGRKRGRRDRERERGRERERQREREIK